MFSPLASQPTEASGNSPTVQSVAPTSGPSTGGTTVIVTGTNFTGATAVRFGGSPAPVFTVTSPLTITVTTPPGNGTVQVTVTTPGGTSTQYVTYRFLGQPTPDPVLTSLSPASGPGTGGTTVTIVGTNLSGATAVHFGATPAIAFTVVSASQITATAPSGTGTVPVTVTTSGGTSNGLPYSYTTAGLPVVTGISPSQGPVSGGNTVTITGSGLSGITTVTFGAVPSPSFTVVSDTGITAVAPPGVPGPVEITVTAPAGSDTADVLYYYVAAPVLLAVVPDSGPVGGGNAVTITGSGLIETSEVLFGATPAASFTVVTDEQITAVVSPAYAGTADLTVVNPGGTSNALPYHYLSPPQVTALLPAEGPASGGNAVTLAGTGLGWTTSVQFGTDTAPFTVVSDLHVVAPAPPGPAGAVDVVLTTPGGTGALLVYTRIAAPEI